MQAMDEQLFFVIDSNTLDNAETRLYGYCIANDNISAYNDNKKDETLIKELNANNYSDGAYVLVQNLESEIKISQDFNGCFGIYLYRSKSYFAISNSFLLLFDRLMDNNCTLTFDYDFAKTYLLSDLTAIAFSETMIKEISLLPKNVCVRIDKFKKIIGIETIDYRDNSVSIDSEKGIEIIDRWYYKWTSVIRYLNRNTDRLRVDLSGGMDSRLVFLLFLKSGIDLKNVFIRSINDKLHTHAEDYEIAESIGNYFHFELNKDPSKNKKSVPLTLDESINAMSYLRLCFCAEINHKLSRNESTLFMFTGSGGEALRKHWNVSPKKFIENIIERGRHLNLYYGDSVKKILLHAFNVAMTKYHIKDELSSAIIDGFYRETRCRNHFGKAMALDFYVNCLTFSPLMDSLLTQLCLDGCKTINRDIIISVIFDRYCPDLLKFKFDSGRKIEQSVIEYAHLINSKYPFIERKINNDNVQSIIFTEIKCKKPESNIITEVKAKSLLYRSFLSSETFEIFVKYFGEALYKSAYFHSKIKLFHPEYKYIPILGIVKILNDLNRKPYISESPTDFFRRLSNSPIKFTGLISDILRTARIDIKNFSEDNENNDIKIDIYDSQECSISKPGWFHKNGFGYCISSKCQDGLSIEVTCLENGVFTLLLRSLFIEDIHKNRTNYYIDYRKLVINKQTVIDSITPCSHDRTFKYEIPVQKCERLSIYIEWEPHNYGIIEYSQIINGITNWLTSTK